MHDIDTFEKVYGEIHVVEDLNKNLLQLSVAGHKSKPVLSRGVYTNENFANGKFVFAVYGRNGNDVVVSVLGTDDSITVEIEHDNIEYDNSKTKNSIRSILTQMAVMRDEVVNDIITYFYQNNIVYDIPCVIENPTDTMAGGITIGQIRKGLAVEMTDEYEHSSYRVEDLDDETLIRLWDWIKWGE